MGTRSGDLDPAVPLFLQRTAGYDVAAVDDLLEHHSGLAGLCGANDIRDVLSRRAAGDPAAANCFRCVLPSRPQVRGRLFRGARPGGRVVFTAGVGERTPEVRAASLDRLTALGVAVDAARNEAETDAARFISLRTVRPVAYASCPPTRSRPSPMTSERCWPARRSGDRPTGRRAEQRAESGPIADAVVQPDHLVDLIEVVQPVGDQQHRPAACRVQQVAGHRGRGGLVEVLGRLVEDEDREVGQQRPGQREPAALAAGQRPAVLADRRLQPGRQGVDPVGQPGRRQGLAQFVVGRARAGRCAGSPRSWCRTGTRRRRSSRPPAARRRRASRRRSTPLSVTRPAAGSSQRTSRAATVLLPAPLGPTSATRWPGVRVSDTSRSTVRSGGPAGRDGLQRARCTGRAGAGLGRWRVRRRVGGPQDRPDAPDGAERGWAAARRRPAPSSSPRTRPVGSARRRRAVRPAACRRAPRPRRRPARPGRRHRWPARSGRRPARWRRPYARRWPAAAGRCRRAGRVAGRSPP